MIVKNVFGMIARKAIDNLDYIGSKEKLNKWIFDTISLFIPKTNWQDLTFLDACAGSGSTSKHAINKGFKVVSNDLMAFSSAIISGYGCIQKTDIQVATKHIENMNFLSPKKGFFYNNYSEKGGRLYFSEENAQHIDAIRDYIKKVKKQNIRNYLLYCSLEAISRVLNTTGVQAAYLKRIKTRAKNKIVVKKEKHTFSEYLCTYTEDILSLLNNKRHYEDILYVDPPYNERQYGPNYHLYETFVRNDNPNIEGKTGLRDWQKESKSDFCSKKSCLQFLNNIIKKARASFVFISYSSDGLLTEKEITDMLVVHFNPEIAVFKKLQNRYKSDSNREYDNSVLTEYLFCVEKKGQKECLKI